MQLQLLQLYISCTVKQTGKVDMDKKFLVLSFDFYATCN